MFFDPHKKGYTDLAGILNTFYQKVDIKIPLQAFLHKVLNSLVHFENLVENEVDR